MAIVAAVFGVFALLFVSGCARVDGGLAVARWQLSRSQVEAPQTIDLPAHIERYLPDRPLTYTLVADVPLPPDLQGRDLTLALSDLQALATLRVNGVVVARLEDVVSERYRSRGPIAWRIPALVTASPSLSLELTVDNTWTQSAWIDSVPCLSASAHGDRWYLFVRGWNDVTCIGALGTLTPIGLAYLFMFLLDRRRSAHGWFAIQALCASYLPFFQLGLSQMFLGRLDAPILAIALAGATIGSVYFTHAQFGLPRPSHLWVALLAAVVLITAIWSGPFTATTHVGPIIVFTFQVVVAHQIWVLARLSRRRPRPVNAVVFLVSWLGLLATGWDDCLAWLGIGEELGGLHAASGGLALFGVLQSLALSRDHILLFRRSDELNVQLKSRVSELEAREGEIVSLNDELRRQIAERSGQLADALARLGNSNAPSAVRLQPGDVIKDRYELVREIGSGAMGMVYEVVRQGDRKRFALKILSGVSGALDMARFAREAQLASHVAHPNVVGIVDIDVAASGIIFIVMELVEGSSLLGLRARYGDVPWALRVLSQLADGLAAIHELGIVHRDLKPANVLLKEDEATTLSVKISDFGVSTIAGAGDASESGSGRKPTTAAQAHAEDELITLAEPSGKRRSPSSTDVDLQVSPPQAPLPVPPTPISASSLTQTGVLLGTPIYMAPELAYGAKHAKPPSDVFSLGVIAHEILTGKRPWAESPAFARLHGSSVAPAAAIAGLCKGLDATLADLFDACLSSDPAARPTAKELSTALRATVQPKRDAG